MPVQLFGFHTFTLFSQFPLKYTSWSRSYFNHWIVVFHHMPTIQSILTQEEDNYAGNSKKIKHYVTRALIYANNVGVS